MGKLHQMCCVVGVLGTLLVSPDAISQNHEDDAAQSLGPGLQRLADLAVTDLATNLNVDEEIIEVVEAQFVTWRDSSAGCPRPGMQYMQVLTNGSRIVLRVDGTIYHYHSGGNRPPFYCAKPSSIEPLPYSHGEA